MSRRAVDGLIRASLDAFGDPPGAATVATSGGLDSTVLARLLVPTLRSRGASPHLACFDHGWRTFAEELTHVQALAQELAVPVLLGAANPAPDRRRAVGPEAQAREARLEWLTSLDQGPIYLGHHADDQAENVLLHGVAMAARRGPFRRPLLAVRRRDLRAVASAADWGWVEDPTNADVRRLRNQLRHHVLPGLEARGELPALMAGGLKALDRRTYVEDQVRTALPAMLRLTGTDRHVLDSHRLLAQPADVAAAALRSLCPGPGRGPSDAAVRALFGSLRGDVSRRHDLGGGWTASVSPGNLELYRPPSAPPQRRPLLPRQDLSWPGVGRLQRRAVRGAQPGDPRLGRERVLISDPERALWVTAAGTGRRMRPFGLGGTKLVSDLLREARVSPPRRSTWPLVVDDADRVLWIPGVRASAHAPLPPGGADATLLLFTDRTARS